MDKQKRILIVDDSQIVLEHARILLEDAGYSVLTCNQPLKAQDTVLRERPDLVLIDVDMPRANGAEIVCALRAQFDKHGSKLFYFSVSDEDVLEKLTMATGADGFVCKGWPTDELLRKLHEQLIED